MSKDNKDATIRAQWAIGQAINIFIAKNQKEAETIESQALELFNMVDRIVEAGNEVEESPASDKQISYLKSLLKQHSKGWIKDHNMDMALHSLLGDNPTADTASKAIDEVLTKGVDPEELVDRGPRDYGPPEPDPRDEDKDDNKATS